MFGLRCNKVEFNENSLLLKSDWVKLKIMKGQSKRVKRVKERKRE